MPNRWPIEDCRSFYVDGYTHWLWQPDGSWLLVDPTGTVLEEKQADTSLEESYGVRAAAQVRPSLTPLGRTNFFTPNRFGKALFFASASESDLTSFPGIVVANPAEFQKQRRRLENQEDRPPLLCSANLWQFDTVRRFKHVLEGFGYDCYGVGRVDVPVRFKLLFGTNWFVPITAESTVLSLAPVVAAAYRRPRLNPLFNGGAMVCESVV